MALWIETESTELRPNPTGDDLQAVIRAVYSVSKANYGARVTRSAVTFEVAYSQLSQNIQNIQRTGGKILSITEA